MSNSFKLYLSAILFVFASSVLAENNRMNEAFDELDRETGRAPASSVSKPSAPPSENTGDNAETPTQSSTEEAEVNNAIGYDQASIKNNTDYKINGSVKYAGCKSDSYSVKPHSKWTAKDNRGVCLISEITGSLIADHYTPVKTKIKIFGGIDIITAKPPVSKHGEKMVVTKYKSAPATSYADFRIDAFGDRYRIYSKHEYRSENSRKSGTSPGFKLINETAWPIRYSFDQAGCLHHGIVPVAFRGKRGEAVIKSGAVWFTMRLYIQPDGLDTQSAWDCAEPVVEIIGDVAFAVLTGGSGAAVSAAVKTGTKVAVKAAAKAVVKAGTKKAIKSIAKNMKNQLGEYLVNSGSVTMEGQYAGYEWPFRCDRMPEYRITGGPEVLVDTSGEYFLSEGNSFSVTKTNTCGNDMMLASATSAKSKTWKMPKDFAEAKAAGNNAVDLAITNINNPQPTPAVSGVGVANLTGFYRLKNRWTGDYMHIENRTGNVQLKTQVPGGWHSAMWTIEPAVGNYFRLKNRWTGDYMHIENRTGHVQLKTQVPGGWHSAMWEKIPVQGNYIRLKNRWTKDYMHIENKQGKVQVSPNLRAGGMWSAQWTLEKVR